MSDRERTLDTARGLKPAVGTRDGGDGAAAREGERDRLRICAVGDFHFDGSETEELNRLLTEAEQDSDVLVLCGDLTTHGHPDQVQALAEVLARLSIPIVAVLGNHEYEEGTPADVCRILNDEAGVQVLDGDAVVVDGIGFAGVKGFAGGFGPGALGAFGEPLIKAFVQEAFEEALKLENALRKLATPVKVAVLHYAPILGTVDGEPEVIYPFLGSSRLLPPLEEMQVDVVFHGHAHRGRIRGETPSGIPVFNVSYPLLLAEEGRGYFIWEAPVTEGVE